MILVGAEAERSTKNATGQINLLTSKKPWIKKLNKKTKP